MYVDSVSLTIDQLETVFLFSCLDYDSILFSFLTSDSTHTCQETHCITSFSVLALVFWDVLLQRVALQSWLPFYRMLSVSLVCATVVPGHREHLVPNVNERKYHERMSISAGHDINPLIPVIIFVSNPILQDTDEHKTIDHYPNAHWFNSVAIHFTEIQRLTHVMSCKSIERCEDSDSEHVCSAIQENVSISFHDLVSCRLTMSKKNLLSLYLTGTGAVSNTRNVVLNWEQKHNATLQTVPRLQTWKRMQALLTSDDWLQFNADWWLHLVQQIEHDEFADGLNLDRCSSVHNRGHGDNSVKNSTRSALSSSGAPSVTKRLKQWCPNSDTQQIEKAKKHCEVGVCDLSRECGNRCTRICTTLLNMWRSGVFFVTRRVQCVE